MNLENFFKLLITGIDLFFSHADLFRSFISFIISFFFFYLSLIIEIVELCGSASSILFLLKALITFNIFLFRLLNHRQIRRGFFNEEIIKGSFGDFLSGWFLRTGRTWNISHLTYLGCNWILILFIGMIIFFIIWRWNRKHHTWSKRSWFFNSLLTRKWVLFLWKLAFLSLLQFFKLKILALSIYKRCHV